MVSDVIWNRSHSFMRLSSPQTRTQSSGVSVSHIRSPALRVPQDIHEHGSMAEFRCMESHFSISPLMIAIADEVEDVPHCFMHKLNKMCSIYSFLFHSGHVHLKKKSTCLLVYPLVKSWHKVRYFQVQVSSRDVRIAPFIHITPLR